MLGQAREPVLRLVEPALDVLNLLPEQRQKLVPKALEFSHLDQQLLVPELRLHVSDLRAVPLRYHLPLFTGDLALVLRLVDLGQGRGEQVPLEEQRAHLSPGFVEVVGRDRLPAKLTRIVSLHHLHLPCLPPWIEGDEGDAEADRPASRDSYQQSRRVEGHLRLDCGREDINVRRVAGRAARTTCRSTDIRPKRSAGPHRSTMRCTPSQSEAQISSGPDDELATMLSQKH